MDILERAGKAQINLCSESARANLAEQLLTTTVRTFAEDFIKKEDEKNKIEELCQLCMESVENVDYDYLLSTNTGFVHLKCALQQELDNE